LDPKKIDPKLLDPKYVFQELDASAKPADVFSKVKEKKEKIFLSLILPQQKRNEE
jgi:AdoMet-dependent rRNA methyltransferase SPB1